MSRGRIQCFARGCGARRMYWQAVFVTSRSADVAGERPFYALHADAYDNLITDPIEGWVQAVHRCLLADEVPHAVALDAGCGTGRHAAGLIELGHDVTLFDASAALLAVARRRCPAAPAYQGDICESPLSGTYQAITCRGVLNDLISDEERDAALESFMRLLRPGGSLMLDVRETDGSRRRANDTEHRTEARLTDGSVLVFTSRSTWRDGLINVAERYELLAADAEDSSVHEYRFQMRPWNVEELHRRLVAAGFSDVEVRPGAGRRTPDRLFVIAHQT